MVHGVLEDIYNVNLDGDGLEGKTNIDDLDPDEMFKRLESIFNNEQKISLLNDVEFKCLEEKLEDKHIKRLLGIKESLLRKEINCRQVQAYCSAALKSLKRRTIFFYLEEICVAENLTLTVRGADLFYIKYLGRSVGEEFLSVYGRKGEHNVILTPAYKEYLTAIANKYEDTVTKGLDKSISLYRSAKKKIIYGW